MLTLIYDHMINDFTFFWFSFMYDTLWGGLCVRGLIIDVKKTTREIFCNDVEKSSTLPQHKFLNMHKKLYNMWLADCEKLKRP